MNILVFDTETIALTKPFCYNVGYIIYDTDNDKMLERRDYIIRQVWNNKPLFETAYYSTKKDLYIRRLKGRTVKQLYFGRLIALLEKDIKKYQVQYGFAYNSQFDEKVFKFNCEWFAKKNPLESLKIYDIRKFAVRSLENNAEYRDFCEENEYFTDSGNYSTTAETVYRFITNNNDFIEEHTALADSIIELEILKKYCNGQFDFEPMATRSIVRPKKYKVIVKGETITEGIAKSMTFKNGILTIK